MYLSIAFPRIDAAERSKKKIDYYEVTVTDSIWDWVTTLGKSPKEKKIIKRKHRNKRAKKRAARTKKAKQKAREKLNEAREKEAYDMREARIERKRRRLKEKKERK